MNGLKYIRMRCNLSLADLAKHIGVSRQIVSAWENGSRGISEKNLNRLSGFFGIERRYFGELSEEDHEDILNRAMYLRNESGNIYYKYTPSCDDDTQVFLPELDMGLDEIYAEAVARQKETIACVEQNIQGNNRNLYVDSFVIRRQCDYYDSLSWILSNQMNQKTGTQLPYTYEVALVLKILRQAFDDKEECVFDDVEEYFGYTKDDVKWAVNMCKEIRKHRLKKVEDHIAENKRKRGTKVDTLEDTHTYREVVSFKRGKQVEAVLIEG